MLRSFLIYLSKAVWMKNMVLNWKIARKVALRFVAGETLAEAIEVSKRLNEAGMTITLDQLGEDTNTADEAWETGNQIKAIIQAIKDEAIRGGVSLKLTQIGLDLDEDLCVEVLADLAKLANQHGIFVRIDMEDSPRVEATLRVYERICKQHQLSNVGMVLQSYLYRAEADLLKLLETDTRIRLVKGAYTEPPDIAFQNKARVDENFDHMMDLLLQHALEKAGEIKTFEGHWPPIPAAGTHDPSRIDYVIHAAKALGLDKSHFEIQMLFGIQRELQQSLTEQGYPVRIYVPFGTEWYPYFMRRLAERPANLWFFLTALFRG